MILQIGIMKGKLPFVLLVILPCLFLSCSMESDYIPVAGTSLEQLYNDAIADAMIADSSEISYNLVPVVKDNEMLSWKTVGAEDYVLAVTFTDISWPQNSGDTVVLNQAEVWVSMVPELYNRLQEEELSTDSVVSLRASQLVGIPYLGKNTFFVEFWVKPKDLFRPTPDNEITDNTAALYFPASATQEYIDWFNSLLIFAYFPDEGEIRYPFTRLGYTYDWGRPDQEHGVSEFVVKQGAKVIMGEVFNLDNYP